MRVEFDVNRLLGSLHFEDSCTDSCDARPNQLAAKDTSKTVASTMKQMNKYIPDTPFHSTKSSTRK